MKLATFEYDGHTRIGRVETDAIVELSAIARDMATLLADDAALARARTCDGPRVALAEVSLCAPVRRPQKILAIGLNYRDHIEETGLDTPQFPMFFNKQCTAANAPYAPIHMPRVSTELDYEGELGFVIGRRCRHVTREQAHAVIAGFVVCNDVSVRDWQMRSQTFTLGKSFDTHSPFGPWIVTPDEVGDCHALQLRTWVNGELRQDSNTRHLVFDCYDQIATLTAVCTLEPGDLVLTGTPSGVGFGLKPQRYLEVGDRVRVEIDKIGAIENEVIAEPNDTAVIGEAQATAAVRA